MCSEGMLGHRPDLGFEVIEAADYQAERVPDLVCRLGDPRSHLGQPPEVAFRTLLAGVGRPTHVVPHHESC